MSAGEQRELPQAPEGEAMPRDEAAERAVLGAMMLSKDRVYEVAEILTAEDFYSPRNEAVFQAILAVADKGEKPDAITVGDQITRMGKTQVVGPTYPFELQSAALTASAAVHYAGIVRDRAVQRRGIEVAMVAKEKFYAGEGDLPALIEQVRTDFEGVASQVMVKPPTMSDLFEQAAEELQRKPDFIPTPWPELNELINGFLPGGLYIFAGRSGDGKTVALGQIALELAARGVVAFSELEMTGVELMERFIQVQARVHGGSLQRRSLTNAEWSEIARVAPGLKDLELRIDDRPGVNVQQVKGFARSVAREAGGKLAGVIVDYVGLLAPVNDKQKEEWNLGEAARQLKVFAREVKAPVILAAQLNRDSQTQRKGTKAFSQRAPVATDLAGSDKLLQHADAVIMLQRQRDEEGKSLDKVGMHVVKARQGNQGSRELLFNGQWSRIDSQQVPII